jgi:hypothetical protein
LLYLPLVCLLHNARGSFHLFRCRCSTAANKLHSRASAAQNTPIKLVLAMPRKRLLGGF